MNEWFEWRDAPPADFAVVGDPIAHSLSPRMHMAAYRALGLDLRYVALRVPSGEFYDAMDHLCTSGFRGVNVTIPLKGVAANWANDAPIDLCEVDSLNTLRLKDRSGTNTDGLAMRDILDEESQESTKNVSVLVLGTGGTARAIMSSLGHAGYRVCAWARTRKRLDAVLEHFTTPIEVRSSLDPAGCNYLINATSASMNGQSLPVIWCNAKSDLIAFDCYYTSGKTLFQTEAEAQGLRSFDGKKLLAYQGARSFEWWTGMKAPREAMLDAVYEDRASD